MARVGAEWDGLWGGVSPPSRLEDLGERRELPQRGPGHSPGRRKRILAYIEGHRTLLFVPMTKSGGQLALASPTPNSGDLSPVPRDLRPWLGEYLSVCLSVCHYDTHKYKISNQKSNQFIRHTQHTQFTKPSNENIHIMCNGEYPRSVVLRLYGLPMY